MAEPLKLEKLFEKSLQDYAQALAAPEGKPQLGSAAALVGALAAALGTLSLSAADPEQAGAVQDAAKELEQLRAHLLYEVDDEVRSRAPLERRKQTPENAAELESAARVACSIPNEVVFAMCRCVELLDQISAVCPPESAATLIAAVQLCLAAAKAMQAQVRALTKYMNDPIFARTVVRETELDLENAAPVAAALLERLEAQL